jgi:hypothetical protein
VGFIAKSPGDSKRLVGQESAFPLQFADVQRLADFTSSTTTARTGHSEASFSYRNHLANSDRVHFLFGDCFSSNLTEKALAYLRIKRKARTVAKSGMSAGRLKDK